MSRYAGDSRAVAQRDADRYRAELEAKRRADVVGVYFSDGGGHWLQVVNLGPSDAASLTLTVEPPQRHLVVEDLPTRLQATAPPVNLPYTRMPGTTPPVTTLRWTDGNGRQEFKVHPNPQRLGPNSSTEEVIERLRRISLEVGSR